MSGTSHDLDLPPEPERRHLSPAPEDYEGGPGLPRLLWTVFWAGLLVALVAVVSAGGWHPFGGH